MRVSAVDAPAPAGVSTAVLADAERGVNRCASAEAVVTNDAASATRHRGVSVDSMALVDGSASGKTRGRNPVSDARGTDARARGTRGRPARGATPRVWACNNIALFRSPAKKSAFTDAANTQGRSPHPAVRVPAKSLRRLLPRARRDVDASRDGDASNPCVPLAQDSARTRKYLFVPAVSLVFVRRLLHSAARRQPRVPSLSQRACRASPLGRTPARVSRAWLWRSSSRCSRRRRPAPAASNPRRAARRARDRHGTTREELRAGLCRTMPETPRRGRRGRGPKAHTDSSHRRNRRVRDVPSPRTTGGARDGVT